jgi:hypothetical protein
MVKKPTSDGFLMTRAKCEHHVQRASVDQEAWIDPPRNLCPIAIHDVKNNIEPELVLLCRLSLPGTSSVVKTKPRGAVRRRDTTLLNPCDAVTGLRKPSEYLRIMPGQNQIRARSDLFHPILGFQV